MLTTTLLSVAVMIGAPGTKEKPNAKLAVAIVGEWSIQSGTNGGMDLPAEAVGKLSLTFTADGKFVPNEGRKKEEGTYKLNADKNPAEIDLISPGGERTIKAIVKIDGDIMTICFVRGDKETSDRPTKFEAPEGSKATLMKLKKVVSEEKK